MGCLYWQRFNAILSTPTLLCGETCSGKKCQCINRHSVQHSSSNRVLWLKCDLQAELKSFVLMDESVFDLLMPFRDV